MMDYFRNLWLAVCGMPGHEIVTHTLLDEKTDMQARLNNLHAHCARMEARVAEFEAKAARDFRVRSEAQRNRNKSGPVKSATVVPLAGPQELS